jgi:type VI secretion system secreted protein Hcp
MPADYYLLVSGVTGESKAAGMPNNIELDQWSFGGNSQPDLKGQGLSAGKPSFSDFNCSFSLDSSSYQLLKNMCQGTHIASSVFTGRKTGGGEMPYTYLTVTMTNCFVTSFSTGGSATGTPAWSLSLAYEKIQYQYYTQDSASGSVTQAGSAEYDLKQVQVVS